MVGSESILAREELDERGSAGNRADLYIASTPPGRPYPPMTGHTEHRFSEADIVRAAAVVHAALPETPQYRWPLLEARSGCELWIKHESDLPIGSFKARGGVFYLRELLRSAERPRRLVLATRGNHGQSIAWAAAREKIPVTVVVPIGNLAEKNAAMRALGATLIEHGGDFQSALEHAAALGHERGAHFVPSFHPWLVLGVASWALELFRAQPDLDQLYVPIGLGSGICGAMAARDALGLRTDIIGVVAKGAPAYANSFAAGRPISSESVDTIADGIACRTPDADALRAMLAGVKRVIAVSDDAIRTAIRHYLVDTHHLAEGAGAAGLAAIESERGTVAGKKVATVLSGCNIDARTLRSALDRA
jgi:threonine dehydratase